MDKGIRCHFSSVVTDTIKAVWFLIVIFLLNLADEIDDIMQNGFSSSKALLFIGILFAIIFVVFLFNFLRWRRTYIYIEDDSLIVERNFIMQKKTTVKLLSIATVNFQQGVLERVFNTYRLQVDINSSATAEKTDFNLVFSRTIAEKLKKELTLDFDNNNVEENDSQNNSSYGKNIIDEVTSIFEFSIKRVIKHGLLSVSVGGVLFSTVMLVFVLLFQFTDLFGVSTEETDGSTLSIFIAVLLVVGPVLFQCISPFVRYLNFKIGKCKSRAVISYGLITKRQFNVPLDKINAIVIKQPVLARLCHLYYGELLSVGMGDDENEQSPVFCLLVNKQELDMIISELAPKFVFENIGDSSPKSAFLPVCVPYVIFGTLAVAISAILGYWWVGAIVLALLLSCAVVSFRTKALAIFDDKAAITTGVFLKRTIIVPFSKIQNMNAKDGPVSRHLGIMKGNVNILSSIFNQINAVGYFPKNRFDTMFKKLIEFDSV